MLSQGSGIAAFFAHSRLETVATTKFHFTGILFIGKDHNQPTAYKLIVEGEEGKTIG